MTVTISSSDEVRRDANIGSEKSNFGLPQEAASIDRNNLRSFGEPLIPRGPEYEDVNEVEDVEHPGNAQEADQGIGDTRLENQRLGYFKGMHNDDHHLVEGYQRVDHEKLQQFNKRKSKHEGLDNVFSEERALDNARAPLMGHQRPNYEESQYVARNKPASWNDGQEKAILDGKLNDFNNNKDNFKILDLRGNNNEHQQLFNDIGMNEQDVPLDNDFAGGVYNIRRNPFKDMDQQEVQQRYQLNQVQSNNQDALNRLRSFNSGSVNDLVQAGVDFGFDRQGEQIHELAEKSKTFPDKFDKLVYKDSYAI